MMKSKKLPVFLLFISILSLNSTAQSDLHFGVSSMAYNLDKQDGASAINFEPGVVFSYGYYLRNLSLAARLTQAIRLDDNDKFAGYTTAKLHMSLYQKWKTDINVGAGAGLAYNFLDIDGESPQGDKNFTKNGDVELSDIFVTGSIEFNYYFNRNLDLSISVDHVYPAKVFLHVGFRYWLSKKIRKKKKCMSCPDWG